MRIGVIGTGTIAAALVKGLAGGNHTITVSERNSVISAGLAAQYTCVSVADNQTVLDQSDVIFIGLMAKAAPEVLHTLTFRPDHKVLSLMAGVILDGVTALVGPAQTVAVMIPFPGIAQGGSPILVLGDGEIVGALFGAKNTIYRLSSEAELAAFMSAQAVLSPAVQMVSDASAWLGAHVENKVQAEAFLRALVGSSLLGDECAPLLNALDTPGGYNQRLRKHMQISGMSEALVAGLNTLEKGG